MNPRAHCSGVLDLAGMAVDAQHHLLKDVLGRVAIGHPLRDEREQPTVEVVPDLRRVQQLGVGRRGQRHPQRSVLAMPQQLGFTSASQHDSCSGGVQQPLLTCGTAAANGSAGSSSGSLASRTDDVASDSARPT